ncbi:MAG TPA: amidohydrolase family protein [Anaerolineales bacterium]|nr:amidohydrolase family protein [Anaerolineales bacterium]
MYFDIRTYLGTSFDGITQSIDELIPKMDRCQVERALVIPLKPLDYRLDRANEWVSKSIQPFADRLIGAARVDPWQPTALQDLDIAVQSMGMRALFLDPWHEQFRADLPITDALLNYAQEKGLPVIIASGFPWRSEALQVLKIALRWPKVPVIMTNGGQINISGLGQADVTLALQKAPNLMIETAGVYRQDFLEESVAAFGASRLIFGSGTPYFDQDFETRRVDLLKVEADQKQAIKSGNALKLLQLS